MTISSWISRRIVLTAAVFFICALPSSALAAVRIVDVMYNPAGADPGREWIQIENIGTTSVALAGYRLHAGGINHKLSVVEGTSTLASGALAIITTDPGQYAADHPAFAGTIFKSSFSLSNVGETIELKDPLLAVVDSYTYTAVPVVKEPAPVKPPKPLKGGATATSSKSKNSTASVALALPTLPALPALPKPWLYGLGTLSLLMLGVAIVLYARTFASAATSSRAEEFNIE